jgi:hypothetical protein
MSLEDLMKALSQGWPYMLSFFTLLPFLSFLLGRMMKTQERTKKGWRFTFSFFVYLVTIPGLLSSVMLAYHLIFLSSNILELDFFAYFLPIVSMVITLSLVHNAIPLAELPGFNRLSGLMMVIASLFVITLTLERSSFRFWIFTSGTSFLIFFALLALAVRFGWGRVMKNKKKS